MIETVSFMSSNMNTKIFMVDDEPELLGLPVFPVSPFGQDKVKPLF